MNSIILYKLLKDVNCDDEAKKECYDLIYRLLCYSAKTRKEGLLSVEDLLEEVEEDIIKNAFITIINNGNDRHENLDHLDHIMLTQVSAGNSHNVELLKQLIIITAIKEIYSGLNPIIILERLSALLGENHEEGLISFLKEKIKTDSRDNEIIMSLKNTLRYRFPFQLFNYNWLGDVAINVIVNQMIGVLNPENNNLTLTIDTSDAFKSRLSLIKNLNFGKGVIFKDDTKVTSKINGNLVLRYDTLDVMPVFVTMGDVSLETGNIVFLGTVIVRGDVQPGCEVKAAGNVYVYGKADPASIEAGGDVFIYAVNDGF